MTSLLSPAAYAAALALVGKMPNQGWHDAAADAFDRRLTMHGIVVGDPPAEQRGQLRRVLVLAGSEAEALEHLKRTSDRTAVITTAWTADTTRLAFVGGARFDRVIAVGTFLDHPDSDRMRAIIEREQPELGRAGPRVAEAAPAFQERVIHQAPTGAAEEFGQVYRGERRAPDDVPVAPDLPF